jgi:quinoprotein glucose dehydrogenase
MKQAPASTIPEMARVWGSPNVGGPMTTDGGLRHLHRCLDGFQTACARDCAAGSELWSGRDLPAPGMAVPMTYMAGGRQYVVIAAGGNAQVGTPISDAVVAYALSP